MTNPATIIHFNRLYCQRMQSTKVMYALETKNHRHYDYSVASKYIGFRFFFDRVMIGEFIRERNITDVKESQFRYRLKKLHLEMIDDGLDDSVLFTMGLVQKSKRTRDLVYLYCPLVLEGVYLLIKSIAAAKVARNAAKAKAKVRVTKPKKDATKGRSKGSGKKSKRKPKPKTIDKKKPPE